MKKKNLKIILDLIIKFIRWFRNSFYTPKYNNDILEFIDAFFGFLIVWTVWLAFITFLVIFFLICLVYIIYFIQNF